MTSAFSRTSVWAALARAVGAREADAQVRNPDHLAERLLGAEELAAFAGHPLLAALRGEPLSPDDAVEVTGSARAMLVRTRFLDERLLAALGGGVDQVVVLGAGFDSRAYRLAESLRGARVFELDQPATQAHKMRRVQDALGGPPSNLTYLAADLRVDDLGERLATAGHRQERRTFFVWEGVTMYLPAEAVSATLRWIATNATGSRVAFDYTYAAAIAALANLDALPLPEPAKVMLRRFQKLAAGEPWLFGLPTAGEADFLLEHGLRLERRLGMHSAEAVAAYLTRADGSVHGGMPANDRQGYCVLEASVP